MQDQAKGGGHLKFPADAICGVAQAPQDLQLQARWGLIASYEVLELPQQTLLCCLRTPLLLFVAEAACTARRTICWLIHLLEGLESNQTRQAKGVGMMMASGGLRRTEQPPASGLWSAARARASAPLCKETRWPSWSPCWSPSSPARRGPLTPPAGPPLFTGQHTRVPLHFCGEALGSPVSYLTCAAHHQQEETRTCALL